MGLINENQVLEALKAVQEPKTGNNPVAMGMIRDVKTDGQQVSFTLLNNGYSPEQKSKIYAECMQAIFQSLGTDQVHIHFMQSDSTLPKENPYPGIKNIIAVASGKGGVGKSTISVNLALSLQQMGARVGLMDADLYGPSIPTMLGLKGKRPRMTDRNGKPMMLPLEAHGLSLISIGFIVEPEQAIVLRGPRLGGIIRQFMDEVVWPELDYLIIDLPPGTGDIQLTLVQTVPLTGVVIVTTPQEVAVIDAVKAMNMFLLPQIDVPILGVVENMSWFTPADLPDRKYFIFGEGGGKKLAKLSDSVLLAQVPLVQGFREGGDTGLPAIIHPEMTEEQKDILIKMGQRLAGQVVVRHEHLAPTKIVKINTQ